MINTLLVGLRENNNLNPEYISNRLAVSVEDYKKLESGELKITTKIAERLGDLYEIAPEYFFTSGSEVIHQNLGTGSNSNSGYIQNYNNYPVEILEEILKNIKSQKND